MKKVSLITLICILVLTLGLGSIPVLGSTVAAEDDSSIHLGMYGENYAFYGDVNLDGEIDAVDALLILKHSVGKEQLNHVQKVLADVNKDNDIHAADALEVLKLSVENVTEFHTGSIYTIKPVFPEDPGTPVDPKDPVSPTAPSVSEPGVEKPLDHLLTSGGNCSIFQTMTVIGDSLSAGEFESKDEMGNKGYHDMIPYSWGKYLEKQTGTRVQVFARGAMTATEYLTSYAGENGYWDANLATQGYILALGVNDILNNKMPIGSVNDIGVAPNYLPKNATFAGYYGGIIKRLQAIQPAARFFLVSMPVDDRDSASEAAAKREHARLLDALAEFFPNTAVIDLNTYAPVHDEAFRNQYYLGNHLNPIGYVLTAEMISSYIDYIIRQNPEAYAQVPFIGTPYYYETKPETGITPPDPDAPDTTVYRTRVLNKPLVASNGSVNTGDYYTVFYRDTPTPNQYKLAFYFTVNQLNNQTGNLTVTLRWQQSPTNVKTISVPYSAFSEPGKYIVVMEETLWDGYLSPSNEAEVYISVDTGMNLTWDKSVVAGKDYIFNDGTYAVVNLEDNQDSSIRALNDEAVKWNGKMKAVTFGFDDGLITDIKLVDLFNRYGLKSTFFLNSEMFGPQEAGIDRINPDQVKALYAGHEVGAHTLTHPNLTKVYCEEVIHQVEQDRLNLEKLVGQPVVGMAYPDGGVNNNEYVASLIDKFTGIQYCRTIVSSHSFTSQENLHRFNPTVYVVEYEKMVQMVDQFLTMEATEPVYLYIWGHSSEINDIGYDKFEAICKKLAGHDDIFYGTNSQVLLSQ